MTKRTMTSVVLLGTLLGSVWLWGGGCDITRIEEEEQVVVDVESIALVEGLLASLSTADTYAKSEAAINTVLEMTGVGMPGSPGPYGRYVLTDEERSSLAQAHVRFVKGELAPEPSLGNSYETISSAGHPITTDLNETLEILEEAADGALAKPLEPGKLLLIVVALEGSEFPYLVDYQHSDRIISPVQEFLFEVWLREHGPSMENYYAARKKSKKSKKKLLCIAQSIGLGGCNQPDKLAVCKKSKKKEKTKCEKAKEITNPDPPPPLIFEIKKNPKKYECFPCGHDQGGGKGKGKG